MEIDCHTPIPELSRRPGVTREDLVVRIFHDMVQSLHRMETERIMGPGPRPDRETEPEPETSDES